MIYEVISPGQELRDLISHFWVGTWEPACRKPNTTYYVIASSLTEITFAFSNNNKHADLLFSAVQGHTHLPDRIAVDGFYHLIGVAFHSYAIPALFNMPASQLNKEFISLDTFLGYEGTILNEKMAMATSTQQRIDLLSGHFISVLKKQKPADRRITDAIKEIKRGNGNIKIEALANDFCLSQKQFGRRFKECSGFSPKTYSKIIRFESVLKHYSSLSDLTGLAHENNYYDQAHFIHEFKSFTGFTPKEFRRLGKDQD